MLLNYLMATISMAAIPFPGYDALVPHSDTIVAVREPLLPPVPKKNPQTLSKSGTPVSSYRFLMIGGSLSAGYRNDGLYREAQQWAYPHLVARQMGVPFQQPLFSKAHGNGTGYSIANPRSDVPLSHVRVKNNLAFTESTDALEPFTGDSPNNYSVPFFSKRMAAGDALFSKAQPFIKRLLPSAIPGSQGEWLSSLDLSSDLFFFEAGFDDLVHSVAHDASGISQISLENLDFTDEMKAISQLVKAGKKGLLLNVPDVVSLPYFQQYNWDVLKKYPVQLKVKRSNSPVPVNFDPEKDLLLPCEKAVRIVTGKLSGTVVLEDIEVLSRDPYDDEILVHDPSTFNLLKIKRSATQHGLPVADLHTLYREILAGGYYTHDGVLVSPDWPNGNFFSADGLYPTSLGQVVIANECIRMLNDYYDLSIPFISVKQLSNAH